MKRVYGNDNDFHWGWYGIACVTGKRSALVKVAHTALGTELTESDFVRVGRWRVRVSRQFRIR